jgi:leishmanolysin-like peptidase
MNYQEYGAEHPFQTRRLTEEVYEPIRITAIYDNETLNLLTPEKRAVIMKIIPDAIQRFQATLKVVRVQGNLFASRTCAIKWMTSPPACQTVLKSEQCLEMTIPADHFSSTRICSTCLSTGCKIGSCSTLAGGQGVPNSDFVLYVRAIDSSFCSGAVVAYAASCQKDQHDRPTFGMANFCPMQIKTNPDEYEKQLSTAMHEITHALGFSAQFFSFMRNPDGTPRTERNEYGNPVTMIKNKCPNGNDVDIFLAPSQSTVKYTNERNQVIARMVTPRVSQFVKDHFGCDQLEGAELESQDDGCIGSHWEERVFEPEIMTPVLSFRNVFSALTLAFFEDSGWYRVNTTMAKRLHFGSKRGCDFATKRCINPDESPLDPDHYCTSIEAESCSVDANSRSICSIGVGKSIPKIYQYFSDPTTGGNSNFADFCPINTGYSQGDCSNPDNLAVPKGTTLNILGETYCPTCKCTQTTLRSDDSSDWIVSDRRKTGCYAMKCTSTGAVDITIPRTNGVSKVTCRAKGEKIQVSGFTGTITCPDPIVVCDRDCPKACSGNGVCDFATSKCSCNDGWEGDDCGTDSKNPAKITLRTNDSMSKRSFVATIFVSIICSIFVF